MENSRIPPPPFYRNLIGKSIPTLSRSFPGLTGEELFYFIVNQIILVSSIDFYKLVSQLNSAYTARGARMSSLFLEYKSASIPFLRSLLKPRKCITFRTDAGSRDKHNWKVPYPKLTAAISLEYSSESIDGTCLHRKCITYYSSILLFISARTFYLT